MKDDEYSEKETAPPRSRNKEDAGNAA